MRSQTVPLLGAAVLGFAAAAVCFTAWNARPASAQVRGLPQIGQPLGTFSVAAPNTPAPPQPIEVQALDPEHFVVATRDARLVQQIGREGTAQQMLVPVVTHYTVRGDRLIPVEHVTVPAGFRLVTVQGDAQ